MSTPIHFNVAVVGKAPVGAHAHFNVQVVGGAESGGGGELGAPGAVGVLAQSAAPVKHTGATAETVLAAVDVPAGVMGVNGMLRVTLLCSMPNSSGMKDFRLRFGAGLAGTVFWWGSFGEGIATRQMQVLIRNRGVSNSQIAYDPTATYPYGFSTEGLTVGSAETAGDQQLLITGQLEEGTDELTLEGYTAEVLNSPA